MSGRIGALNTAGNGIVSSSLLPSAEATETVGLLILNYLLLIDDSNSSGCPQ